MDVKEDGALPVPKKDQDGKHANEKDDANTNPSGEEDNQEEEEKEMMDLEEKKYIFSDKQWKLIVSLIGTGLIITLVFLTLNLVNTLLKGEG
mmetsp:Transcript_21049/g.20742  ORF Transcript_21049/g.20742 Transcript_21049/m.20742 type:complete len:92 (+) Transcript_21049:28-303(+)